MSSIDYTYEVLEITESTGSLVYRVKLSLTNGTISKIAFTEVIVPVGQSFTLTPTKILTCWYEGQPLALSGSGSVSLS